MIRSFSISLLCWLAATMASGQEWTRFRGPNGSGVSESAGIPTTWTDKDYRWRVELPGGGHSSPVLWGDRVYVTTADDTAGSQTVLSLATATGKVEWQKAFASPPYKKHASNSFASSTPTVDQDRLYVTWSTPERYTVVALDRHTGEERWRRDLGVFKGEHGSGGSVICHDGLVIVPKENDAESFVVALDAATGVTRWKTDRRSQKTAFSTPIVFQPEGGAAQIILTSWAHGVSSLDAATGKPNWELPLLKNRTVGSPLLAAGLVFFSAGEGGIGRQFFVVMPGNPARQIEPRVAYPVESAMPYVPTPVAKGNLVFLWGDQGVITCLDAPTGRRLWQERVGGKYFGSPVRVGERLYCMSREGQMVVLAASDHYQLLGRIDLGEASHATPAVAGGVMYLRTVSHLMAIGRGGQ